MFKSGTLDQSEDGSGLAALIARIVSPSERAPSPALVQRSSSSPDSSVYRLPSWVGPLNLGSTSPAGPSPPIGAIG